MALKIKGYLHFGGQGPEVRYFSVPQEASTSFKYWVGKVRQIYPSLKDKDFKLLWRDTSAEFITFSSDEELKEALDLFTEDVFKLFITVSDGSEKWCPNKRAADPWRTGKWHGRHGRFGSGASNRSMWPFGFWEEWKSSPCWNEGTCREKGNKEEEFDMKKCAQKVKEVIDSAYHAFMSYDPEAEAKAAQKEKEDPRKTRGTDKDDQNGDPKEESSKTDDKVAKVDSESATDVDKQGSKDDGYILVQEQQKESASKYQANPPNVEKDPQQRKLEEALSQMEAMGFHNENGWLAQLLVSKDYDVGRVINTILPQGRPH